MKKLWFSPYCILLIIANCVSAILLTDIAEDVRQTYMQIRGGTMMEADLTRLMVGFPRWFWLFGALSFLTGIGIFVRRVPAGAVLHLLLIVALLDVIALFFFALGIGLYFIPALEKSACNG
jgi:hypothetical protein